MSLRSELETFLIERGFKMTSGPLARCRRLEHENEKLIVILQLQAPIRKIPVKLLYDSCGATKIIESYYKSTIRCSTCGCRMHCVRLRPGEKLKAINETSAE
ncbi:hypothetical protein AYK25_04305 [Thermoplasmatales archaeon SM1-50]|nr:MAG: hypothetical protein AYK25_04305 [Thermoplasmatales archaeon SM1-50]